MNEFDVVFDRRDTSSSKWDRYSGTDILPMWVADMDFKSPPAIIQAIKRRADQGIFGYHSQQPQELTSILIQRLKRLYDWQVNAEEILFTPGVVPALNQTCRSLVRSGESIVTVTPVYFPFLDTANNWHRKLYRVPANYTDHQWSFPVDELAEMITSNPDIRLLLLCSPLNPVGKMLTKNQLHSIVEVCKSNQVTICSDEIHCELLFDDRKHIPTASVSGDAKDICITLMSATKTFNLAGLGGSIVIIKNPELREKYLQGGRGIMPNVTTFAFTTMLTAYRDCDQWREALLRYLQANRDYLARRIESIEGISMNQVEATYLAWLDVRALKLDDAMEFFEHAGIGLSDGEQFEGPGFMRLNFACPRATLVEACDRIERAVLKHEI